VTTTMTRKPRTQPEPPASLAARARAQLRAMGRTQFTCHCGCGRQWKDYRMMNAHFLKNYGGYWGGKGGKAMGRQIGKGKDGVRRMGRGGLEAFGHVDRMGRRTHRARTRPETPPGKVHLRLADLRDRHRHGQDHDRADRHDRKADRAGARGDTARQADRQQRAANLRNRHPERPRPAAAPRPDRDNGRLNDLIGRAAAHANGNGSRPAPERETRTPR
jgi:hypothetical protein